jgi:hypothetical protein
LDCAREKERNRGKQARRASQLWVAGGQTLARNGCKARRETRRSDARCTLTELAQQRTKRDPHLYALARSNWHRRRQPQLRPEESGTVTIDLILPLITATALASCSRADESTNDVRHKKTRVGAEAGARSSKQRQAATPNQQRLRAAHSHVHTTRPDATAQATQGTWSQVPQGHKIR